jgi:phospho-N-acetylmuramoyl-pentapeptide-transferase
MLYPDYYFLITLLIFISYLILTFIIKNSFIFKTTNREFLVFGNHQLKAKIPSMGGIVFYLSIPLLLYLFGINPKILFIILSSSLSGLIGLIDDMSKRKTGKGISANKKLLYQILTSLISSFIWFLTDKDIETTINLGFCYINIGYLFIFWCSFVLISTSNAINLTDGIDGLATTQSIISLLGLIFLKNISNITLLSSLILIIILLIFLIFNKNPAKIFMGDVGALFLGGYIASLFLVEKKEILLIFGGLVFVLETVSVILQIFWIKTFKKKLFIFTPIHHAFEKNKWNENSINTLAILISLIGQFIMIYIDKSLY